MSVVDGDTEDELTEELDADLDQLRMALTFTGTVPSTQPEPSTSTQQPVGSPLLSSDVRDEMVDATAAEVDTSHLLLSPMSAAVAGLVASPLGGGGLGPPELPPHLDVGDLELPAHCLQLNLQFQEVLKLQLKNVDAAMKRNQELRRTAFHLALSAQRVPRKSVPQGALLPHKRNFGTTTFVDVDDHHPPDNVDTIRKRKHRAKMPLVYKFKKWSKEEKQVLAKGVRQLNQEQLMTKLLDQFQRSNGRDGRTVDVLQKEIEDLSKLPHDDPRLLNTTNTDWDMVARRYLSTRLGVDCKIEWMGTLDPRINHSAFTAEEDRKLVAAAGHRNGRNWEEIAKELVGRTPVQCLRRYQQKHNAGMIRKKWTRDEDEQLAEAVRLFGEKNWQQVAHCLEGRTGQQCLHRWQKTLNPNIKRGRWTAEEDQMLAMSVKAYGPSRWVLIAKHVPGRTDVQCRERWVNIVNPELNHGPWTQEEDEKLLRVVEEHGAGSWSKLASFIERRTDNQCWRRWKTLTAHERDDDVGGRSRKRKARRVGDSTPTLTPSEGEPPEGEEEEVGVGEVTMPYELDASFPVSPPRSGGRGGEKEKGRAKRPGRPRKEVMTNALAVEEDL